MGIQQLRFSEQQYAALHTVKVKPIKQQELKQTTRIEVGIILEITSSGNRVNRHKSALVCLVLSAFCLVRKRLLRTRTVGHEIPCVHSIFYCTNAKQHVCKVTNLIVDVLMNGKENSMIIKMYLHIFFNIKIKLQNHIDIVSMIETDY